MLARTARRFARVVDRSFIPPPPPPSRPPYILALTLAIFAAGGVWVFTREPTEDDVDVTAFLRGVAARGSGVPSPPPSVSSPSSSSSSSSSSSKS